MWARNVSSGHKGIEQLCVSCHEEQGVADKKALKGNNHPVNVPLPEISGHVNLPLYKGLSPKGSPEQQVDCASCHNPHQWDPKDIGSQAGRQTEVEGDGETSFLRVEAMEDGKLCLECHK